MVNKTSEMERITDQANRYAERDQCDIILFSAPIDDDAYEQLLDELSSRKCYQNAIFCLWTFGGDADAAYRICRVLQNRYRGGKISLYVPKMCKSAGTLIAIGADELVMSSISELGPLDVQIPEPDELASHRSGLTSLQASSYLQTSSFEMFESNFLNIVNKSRSRIATKTAAHMATQLTVGLYRPLYEQLNPMRLGDNIRAMRIADAYAQLLLSQRNRPNLKKNALEKLVAGYPSHSFVIDAAEAKSLFINIREPDDYEQSIDADCGEVAFTAMCNGKTLIQILNDPPALTEPMSTDSTDEETTGDEQQNENGRQGSLVRGKDRKSDTPAGKQNASSFAHSKIN